MPMSTHPEEFLKIISLSINVFHKCVRTFKIPTLIELNLLSEKIKIKMAQDTI